MSRAPRQEDDMPEKRTIERARKDARQGKAPSTQAGEFVREEFHHIREGKHGARSTKQAIAIGLSKARRAGVRMPPPRPGSVSKEAREHIARDARRGRTGRRRQPSATRSRAVRSALKREGHAAASHDAIARQAHRTAVRRGPSARHKAALRAARTRARRRGASSARRSKTR